MKGLLFFIVFLLFAFCLAPAQLQDNFSDGDFTANPIWTGESGNFLVNGSFELQSQGNCTATDTLYLVSPNTLMDSTEWNILVDLDFNPATTNYVRIYLVSDQANLQNPLNGYFIQLGESAAVADSVSLNVQTGTTITQISGGTMGCISSGASTASVRLKIKRSISGVWDILADCSGGYNFVSHGSVLDLTHTSTSWFGVYCRYATASRCTMYHFDDILISPFIGDTVRPLVDTAFATSTTTVTVDFSEPVSLSTSQNILNYSAAPVLGNPISAIRNGVDSSLVTLTFAATFSNGQVYALTIFNVEDSVGNAMASPQNKNFVWYIPAIAAFKDVLINEIFADPDTQLTGLPNAEFVELFNRSTQAFNLNGWKFSDGTTTATLPTFTLIPGAYIILCKTADTSRYNSFGTVVPISLPTLNNSGDNLGLRNNSGTMIDSVEYVLAWYQDAIKDDGGWTLELKDPTDTCQTAGNWIASNQAIGGTPGTQNSVFAPNIDITPPSLSSFTFSALDTLSLCFNEKMDGVMLVNPANYVVTPGGITPIQVIADANATCVKLVFSPQLDSTTQFTLNISNAMDCPGNVAATISQNFKWVIPGIAVYKSVVINEIFADPDSVLTSMPNAEFLELYNRDTSIYNLFGWTVSDGGLVSQLPAYFLNPGSYVILCREADTSKLSPFGPVLGFSMPTLNNSGDFLGIRNYQNSLVDTVPYIDDWYRDVNKMGGGWSLELIDPDDTCKLDSNWIASSAVAGGTPGIQNSIMSTQPDILPPVIISALVLNSNTLRLCFNEKMDGQMLVNLSLFNVTPSAGTLLSASPQANLNCTDLTFSLPFDTGQVYQITVTNARDCAGNISANLIRNFGMGAEALPGQVVFTEIFPDPSPRIGLPELEFVEIHNPTSTIISLTGWKITDRASTPAILPDMVMLPGEFSILCPTASEDSFQLLGTTYGISSFPSLNNTGDSLELLNANDQIMDRVYYSDDWYLDEIKKDGGWTLERIDPNFVCPNGENWRASNHVKGGTPGQINSINGIFTDTKAPTTTNATVSSAIEVILRFSEPIENSTLSNPSNYFIDNGIGNPISATPVGSDFKAVSLILPSSLDTNRVYLVTVSNLTDCPGNAIGVPKEAMFGIPLPAVSGDILINEILFNPQTGGSDFVELYNQSDKIIDLADLQIGEIYEGTDSAFNLKNLSDESLLFFPAMHLAFTADKNYILNTFLPPFSNNILSLASFPSYDDTEGECVVQRLNGNRIDHFSYLDDYHYGDLDDDEGVSLERISWDRPTQEPGNWHSAASTVRYGTPGYLNSQWVDGASGNSNVWLDPATFSPDNDGLNDVVHIRYKFSEPGNNLRFSAFDNQGRFVKNIALNILAGTEEGAVTWDGINEDGKRSDTGIYVILVEVSNINSGKTEKIKLGLVLAQKF